MKKKAYDTEFQNFLVQTSTVSASKIVPYILDLVRPKSVVDVGCGIGAWISKFRDLGNLDDYLGIDGDYIDKNILLIDAARFMPRNLEQVPFDCGKSFDLAVSLEVAEHLSEDKALPFVETLTGLAPVVLFSAAIPWQGGTNHINEQWPDYWAEKFAAFDYVPIDCLRRKFWNDKEVSWWYSQNIILYVKKDRLSGYPDLEKLRDPEDAAPLPLVHPNIWSYYRTHHKSPNAVALFFGNVVGKIRRVLCPSKDES